jgi:uroporphyrinogen decarboxylase
MTIVVIMRRRDFVRSLGIAPAALAAGLGTFSTVGYGGQRKPVVDKRNAVLNLLYTKRKQDYYPGGFFVHFPKEDHFGPSAIERHLDYFRYTDLDFLKIQYELKFPLMEEIQKPSDWSKVPLLKKEFYEEQLKVIEGVIKEGKKEALVIATVYPPLALAGHLTGYKHHVNHFNEDPDATAKGMEIITESVMIFVKECIKLGVDGFLQSSQGGEANRFEQDSIFEDYIKPLEVAIGQEMADNCLCNVLHIHNGGEGYRDYRAFVDYPGHIINCGLHLKDRDTTTKELYSLFGKPIMGGFDRDKVIYEGSISEIKGKAREIIAAAPQKFLLGATCTVPGDIEWANIRAAQDAAHAYVGKK